MVLLLLVSCATRKTDQEATPESVEIAVVEQLPPSVVSNTSEDVPPVEESDKPQGESSSEEAVSDVQLVSIEEDIPPEPGETVSSEAPVTDWGYVFTNPSPAEVAAAQKESEPVNAEEMKSTVSKPASSYSSVQVVSEKEVTDVQKTSSITKVAYFISHETLFSLGLVVCLSGLIYFIVALVRSSGMVERKKPVIHEEEPSEPSSDKEDVEPQDNSSGFDSEDENDEFLRALLGENKR